MPCHQCGGAADAGREGACTICRADARTFCPACAYWELGPVPAATGLRAAMRAYPQPVTPVKTCPLRTAERAQVQTEFTNRCALLADQLASSQLWGQAFSEVLDSARALYDQFYSTVGYDNTMMHALISVQFSAQAHVLKHRLVRDAQMEEYEDARSALAGTRATLAREHTAAGVAREKFGKAKTPEAQQAVRVEVQQIMDRITPLETRIALATGAAPRPHRRYHRHDILAISLFHLNKCFISFVPADDRAVARAAVQTEVVELVLKGKMAFPLARAELLRLGGDDVAVARRILEVAAMLYHARTAFWTPDGAVQGGFDPRGAQGYVHPTFKTFLYGNGAANPPALSDAARTKLGTLYAALDLVVPGGPRYPDATVPTTLSASVQAYLQSLPVFDTPTAAAAARSECEVTVRTRVLERLAPLLDIRDGTEATTLDAIIADLRANADIESASGDGLLNAYNGNANLALRSEAGNLAADIPWSEILSCAAGGDGNYRGMDLDIADHRGRTDGRQNAWHYLDWRNDKDRYMYDYYEMPIADRPVFVSLSMTVDLPEVNTRYGSHMIVWDRASVIPRSVFTLGDKGIARRSMLLLLRDLLYPIPQKDGSPAIGAKDRLLTFLNITERYTQRGARRALTQTNYTTLLTEAKTLMSIAGNVECHVFGPLRPGTHATAIVFKNGGVATTLHATYAAPAWTYITYDEALNRATAAPGTFNNGAQVGVVG
jgi:hypothetical protein